MCKHGCKLGYTYMQKYAFMSHNVCLNVLGLAHSIHATGGCPTASWQSPPSSLGREAAVVSP